ncbi:MAG: hypothetical protein IKD69_03455 [Solobacterium sp.]|nr:hypothetical protein [Solobacterium sp.]
MAKLPTCPCCGSKNVSRIESFYTCTNCKKSFGRDPKANDGSRLAEVVNGLRFKFGDIDTGSSRLRFVQDGEVCLYEVIDTNGGKLAKIAGVLSAEDWKNLRESLFADYFVSDWEREYIPANDGREIRGNNAWAFDVIVSDEEEYSYGGVDAFPVYFDRFRTNVIEPYFMELAEKGL